MSYMGLMYSKICQASWMHHKNGDKVIQRHFQHVRLDKKIFHNSAQKLKSATDTDELV